MLSIAEGRDAGYLTKQVAVGGENYYLKAIDQQGEPAGLWMGRGAADLGLSGEVDPKAMETLYGEWRNPETGEQLGRAPMAFKPLEERLEAALAKEPHATPERRAEIERQVEATQRSGATKYVDLTFSAPKSWSLLHAGFQVQAAQARTEAEAARAGGDEERAVELEAQAGEFAAKADAVWDSYMEGVEAAMEYLADNHETRVGYHGRAADGSSVGRWAKADRLTAAAFRQHTSRNDDPQLHVHVAVLNKVAVTEHDPVTGAESTRWLTLDSRGIRKMKPALGAIQERASEEALYRRTGMRVEMRPDGKAREIVGIGQDKRDEFSTRRQQITGALKDLVGEFEERNDRAPSPYELSCMAQFVTLDSRNWKSKTAPTRAELLERWDATSVDRLRTSLADVAKDAEWASTWANASEDMRDRAFDPNEVIRDAVAEVQRNKTTFTRYDLMAELNRQLPDLLGGLEQRQVTGLLDQLADEALTPGNEAAVVLLAAPDKVPAPLELQHEDGRSVYSDRVRYTYATGPQMTAEAELRAALARTGAPAIPAETVDRVLDGLTLDPEQAAFVRGAATSGHFMEVLAAPAGAGKSYALSALTSVWKEGGGDVIGVATARQAANVLQNEGVENTTSIAALLRAHQEAAATGRPVSAQHRIGAGTLLIVDEAGMSATTDLAELRAIVEKAGGKMLTTGDHRQLTPVEAGGVFADLVQDLPNVHTFEQVRRFRDIDPETGKPVTRQWEAEASLALREGRPEALGEYEAHGRFRAGSAEEMVEQAYQGWFADHMAGRDALLIARTNGQAAELSSRARADLVRAGRVEADGVRLHDDTLAGRGDLVQLRLNASKLKTASGKRWAVNRDVVEVVGRGDDGTLTVRYKDGDTLALPADYVAEHVELAYAGTVHAAQGRTVEVCRSLIDESGSRESLYVAMTRGWGANIGYVVTHDEAAGAVPAEEIPPMHAVLASALGNSELELSAHETIRRGQEASERLDTLAPMWTSLVEQEAKRRFGAALLAAVGDEQYARISQDDAYEPLMRLARHAEAEGHNAARMLADTATSRELDTADNPARAVHWRMEQELARAERVRAREDERRVAEAVEEHGPEAEADIRAQIAAERAEQAGARAAWADRTPYVASELGAHLDQLAAAMDERRTELGEQQANAPEPWALARLGAVPEDPIERAGWTERAGWIAQYREAYGYDHDTDAIGACPPRGSVDARAAWEAAYRQIGAADERRDVAGADDAQLRAWGKQWEREQAWAPPYVADELAQAHAAADDYRARAAQARLDEAERAAELAAQAQQAETEREPVEAQPAGAQVDQAEELPVPAWLQPDDVDQDQQHEPEPAAVEAAEAERVVDVPVPDGPTSEEFEQFAAILDARASMLGDVHEARKAWEKETRTARELADQAQNELDRRTPPADVDTVAADPTAAEPRGLVNVDRAIEQAAEAQRILAERAQAREMGPVETPELAAEEADRERRDQGFAAVAARTLGLDRAHEVTAQHQDDAPPPPPAPEPEPEPEHDIDM